jgi:hypothetical protein
VVMIGIDPHKGSHTAAAIGPGEEPLGQMQVLASASQVGQRGAAVAALIFYTGRFGSAKPMSLSSVGGCATGVRQQIRDTWGRRLPCARTRSPVPSEGTWPVVPEGLRRVMWVGLGVSR